jgi:uncharacterized membrane protein
MNGAHWHLIVNHLPIIFPVVGVIVMLTGMIAKSEAVKRTAYLIFFLGALSAFAAMATGEGAEEVVENISGVTENYIETHEESAEVMAILSYVLGGISLLGLWTSFKQKPIAGIVSWLTLVMSLVVLFFARQTGTTGGEIRHTEIRAGVNLPSTGGRENNEEHH